MRDHNNILDTWDKGIPISQDDSLKEPHIETAGPFIPESTFRDLKLPVTEDYKCYK